MGDFLSNFMKDKSDRWEEVCRFYCDVCGMGYVDSNANDYTMKYTWYGDEYTMTATEMMDEALQRVRRCDYSPKNI